jgi:hypothetical protein
MGPWSSPTGSEPRGQSRDAHHLTAMAPASPASWTRRHIVPPVLVGEDALAPAGHFTGRPTRFAPQSTSTSSGYTPWHTEASPHVARHHARVVLRHAEDLLGEEPAQPVRHLRARLDRVPPRAPIVLADCARLEGAAAALDVGPVASSRMTLGSMEARSGL